MPEKHIRTSDAKRRGSPNKEKKKCRNRQNLFLRAERACPNASKFETFIPLVRLVFELELFKAIIGVSVFGLETCITRPIASKVCTKNDSYVPHLSSKFQVSTFSHFKVIAFSSFVCEFVIIQVKKHKDFRAEVPKIKFVTMPECRVLTNDQIFAIMVGDLVGCTVLLWQL